MTEFKKLKHENNSLDGVIVPKKFSRTIWILGRVDLPLPDCPPTPTVVCLSQTVLQRQFPIGTGSDTQNHRRAWTDNKLRVANGSTIATYRVHIYT